MFDLGYNMFMKVWVHVLCDGFPKVAQGRPLQDKTGGEQADAHQGQHTGVNQFTQQGHLLSHFT